MTITIIIVTAAATVVIGGGFQAGPLTRSLPSSIPSARPVRVGSDSGQGLVQLARALVIQRQEHLKERGGG